MKIKNLILSLSISLTCLSGNALAIGLPVMVSSNTQLVNNQLLPDFSAIYEAVGKSVVNITVSKLVQQQVPVTSNNNNDPLFDYWFKRMVPPSQQRKYRQNALGSGFVISEDGYILTNAHVVQNADTVTVKLNDKREFKARIVGYDSATDVALLKINVTGLPGVRIGNPNLMKPGNWVVAIGSPFGLENTITQGTISAVSRNLPDDAYIPFIQTDVPINPGNSGGPLINLNGDVIGINSQIYSQSGGYMGIAFAIPIDYAITVAEQLKTTGKVVRGKIGLAVQPLTDDLAQSFGLPNKLGVLVNTVEPNLPAARAGVQVGDIILKANQQQVVDAAMLPRLVGQLGPNKKLLLTIWRNGKTMDISVTTVLLDSTSYNKQSVKPTIHTINIDKLGLTVQELSDASLLPKGYSYGLIIQNATQDVQLTGIVQGDLIVGVGSNNINSLSDFNLMLSKYAINSRVPLKLLRGDKQQYTTIFVPLSILK